MTMRQLLLACSLFLLLPYGDLWAARLSRAVTPEQYRIVITPRLQFGTFLGDEIITVRVTEPVREITLHAADLDIERVHVRDGERRQRAKFELDPATTTMTIRLRKELVPGAAEIRISYRGPLRDDLRGLYVSRSAKDEFLFTQLQPVDARRFFPCFDEPDLKAQFDLTVVVKDGDVAISNTKMVSSLPGPTRGTRRIRFGTTPPMSTYMLALAVGPFDCLRGRHGETPVRFCAQSGQAWKGRATHRGSIELLEFYERWFGLPYPFEKLDVVALPDMGAGGMENPGAIFLRESWAMVDDDAGLETRRWASTLLAHELSHLWVGDLVTMEWWSDVWLNEGLATWLSAKALNAWRPEVRVDEIQTFRRMRTFDEDSLGSRRAVAAPVVRDDNLFELFNLVTNEKPAAVMSMVEEVVGEEPLRRALRDYLVTYSWGNASTDDFLSHLGGSLGTDVADVVRDFVMKPGFPVIEASSRCDEGDAVVEFSQKKDGGEPWHVPVCWRTLDETPTGRCIVATGRASVRLPALCGVPVLVNPGEPGYYRVIYSGEDLSRIVGNIDLLTAPERLNLLDNEWWLVSEGHRSASDFLMLLERGFASEEHPSVMSMVISRLAMIDRQYVAREHRSEYRGWMRAFFGQQLDRVGIDAVEGERPERVSLRRELLWGAGALARDPAVVDQSRRFVRDYLDDPRSVDPKMVDIMIHIAARSGDEALYNTYLAKARRARDTQEKYRFLMGLVSFTSPALVRRTIELTLTDVVRAQDATSIVGKLLANPDSAEAAWQVVRERWPEIEKRVPVTFTSDRIVYGAGSFCSRERRAEVESFFSTVTAPPRSLEVSLARIDRCIASRSLQQTALAGWLSEEGRVASKGSNPR
jgi:aminopeptidase N